MCSDFPSIPQNRRFQSIPAELRDLNRWVLVRLESSGKGKPTKIPYTPSGRKASSTESETWSSFSEVLLAAPRFDGIGFVFTDTPYFGVDLDHCAPGGVVSDEAQTIINSFATYAELSFSGDGVHIIGRGSVPGGTGRKRGDKEAYSEGRYFTMSGRPVPGSVLEVHDRQAELTDFMERAFPVAAPAPMRARTPSVPSSLSDRELLDKAMNATSGAAFNALWNGNTGAYGNDHSAADMALCHSLAFWWQADADAVDRMFRQSGLMRDKWDERRGGSTYGQTTIAKALETQSKTYTPPMPPEPRPRPQAPQKPTRALETPAPAAELLTGVMAQLAGRLKGSPIRVKPMGAAIADGATEGDFLKAMRAAMREKDAADTPLQLFMGDLYNQLKLTTPHGGMRAWVLQHFNGNEGFYCNLRKLGCVSAAWPEDLRRPGQSYEFYREGASLPDTRKAEIAFAIDQGEYKSAAAVKQEKAALVGKVSAPKGLRVDLAELVADRGEEFAARVLRMARSGALDAFLNCPATASNVPTPEHLALDSKCSASVFTASIAEHMEEADTPAPPREHLSRASANVPAPEHLEAVYWDADPAQEEQAEEQEQAESPEEADDYEPGLASLSGVLGLEVEDVKRILNMKGRHTRKPSYSLVRDAYLVAIGKSSSDPIDLSEEAVRRMNALRDYWEDTRARETAFPF